MHRRSNGVAGGRSAGQIYICECLKGAKVECEKRKGCVLLEKESGPLYFPRKVNFNYTQTKMSPLVKRRFNILLES